MTKKKHKDLELVPTEEMLNDLRALLNLKASQIIAFAKVVNTRDGFEIPKETNLSQFVRDVKLTSDELQQVYSISKFLYDKFAEAECVFDASFNAIQLIAQQHGLPSPSRKRMAFQKLFSVSAEYLKKRKVEPYRQGIVRNVSAIASTHELRAVFDDESDGEVDLLGYVPVVTVRLVAEDDKENKETLIFSVDENRLGKLIESLTKIKDKLERVKKNIKGKGVELL
jgi:hypothetical protein